MPRLAAGLLLATASPAMAQERTVWCGTLTVHPRRTMLWDAGRRLDIDEAHIGWTKRF